MGVRPRTGRAVTTKPDPDTKHDSRGDKETQDRDTSSRASAAASTRPATPNSRSPRHRSGPGTDASGTPLHPLNLGRLGRLPDLLGIPAHEHHMLRVHHADHRLERHQMLHPASPVPRLLLQLPRRRLRRLLALIDQPAGGVSRRGGEEWSETRRRWRGSLARFL